MLLGTLVNISVVHYQPYFKLRLNYGKMHNLQPKSTYQSKISKHNPVDSNNDLLEANEEENEHEMDETNRKDNDYEILDEIDSESQSDIVN